MTNEQRATENFSELTQLRKQHEKLDLILIGGIESVCSALREGRFPLEADLTTTVEGEPMTIAAVINTPEEVKVELVDFSGVSFIDVVEVENTLALFEIAEHLNRILASTSTK